MSGSFVSYSGLIDFKGYKYCIYDNIAEKICGNILKDIPLIANNLFCDNGINAKYYIKDSMIFLNELSLRILENDVSKIESGYPCNYELLYEDHLVVDSIPKIIRVAVLKYNHLDIPISCHGKISAKQIYVDEVDLIYPHTHDRTSSFVFSRGNLIESESCIFTSDVPYISRVTWNKQNFTTYMKQIDDGQIDKTSRKLFYVTPTGTALQNETTISLVINYALNNISSSELLKQLFEFKIPKLKVICMAETEPSSGRFNEVIYDLIPYNINMKVKELMDIYIKYYMEYRKSILSMIEK